MFLVLLLLLIQPFIFGDQFRTRIKSPNKRITFVYVLGALTIVLGVLRVIFGMVFINKLKPRCYIYTVNTIYAFFLVGAVYTIKEMIGNGLAWKTSVANLASTLARTVPADGVNQVIANLQSIDTSILDIFNTTSLGLGLVLLILTIAA